MDLMANCPRNSKIALKFKSSGSKVTDHIILDYFWFMTDNSSANDDYFADTISELTVLQMMTTLET